MKISLLMSGVMFCLLALLEFFLIAPKLTRLPADYVDHTSYSVSSQFRPTPTAPWENISMIARRVDQTLSFSEVRSIIQGDLHWTTSAGVVVFESSGIYGVDRHTRTNLPAYGDQPRTGQFVFPIHTEPKPYHYWDTAFIGPRMANFNHSEMIDGIQLYVFKFTGSGMDETAGYTHLKDVPERYLALSKGEGTLTIEPISGTIVNYVENGYSYFADPVTRKEVTGLFTWHSQYTHKTQTDKWSHAKSLRFNILLLEVWLPFGLLIIGLSLLLMYLWLKNKNRLSLATTDFSVSGEKP